MRAPWSTHGATGSSFQNPTRDVDGTATRKDLSGVLFNVLPRRPTRGRWLLPRRWKDNYSPVAGGFRKACPSWDWECSFANTETPSLVTNDHPAIQASLS